MKNQPIRFVAFVALAGAVAACGNTATAPSENSPSTGGAPTAGGTATNGGNSTAGGSGNSTTSAGSGVGGNSQTGGGTSTTATGGNTGAAGGASSGGASSATGGATPSTGTATGGAHTGGASSSGGAHTGGSGGQQSTTTGGSTAQGGNNTGGTSSAVGGGSSTTGGQSTTGGATAWSPSAACVQKASALYDQLSLPQRVGQMTQINSTDSKGATIAASAVSSAFLGAVLSGGGTYPSASDVSVSAWSTLISGYLNAGKSSSPHVGVLFGLDSVHGNDKVANSVMFPHNIGLGATRNEALVENAARITALEMLGVGANWAFAPAVGTARDIRWGRTYETFSSEPDLAGQLGAAAVRGLQNGKLSSNRSVLACAKHFAGDGATDGGKNTGDSTLDETTFRKVAVDPYRPSIATGVGSIMPSYSSYKGAPLTDSKKWLTDVLKTELGFQGFLISDWDAVGRLTDKTVWNDQVAAAVGAGIDMLMVAGGATGTGLGTAHTAADVASALTAYNGTAEGPARIKDAVTRILTIKCEMGLLDGDTSIDASLTSSIGSAEHRAVARDAVKQSMVVLKNDGILPLSKSGTRIHVTGSGADSMAKQCGGWTLGWQGMGTTGATATLTGTTVLGAVKKAFTGTVTTSSDGSGASGADHAIVVVGETPYAETQGDTKNGAAPTLSTADFAAIAAVKAANVPFVVVLFSGRPLVLTDSGGVSVFDESNGVIAAWLPGTEGDGIADVLFGDYKPTGKLGFEWPSSSSQLPLNVGDGQAPLFAYGFGLTYP
jgi:beta-glucosidase